MKEDKKKKRKERKIEKLAKKAVLTTTDFFGITEKKKGMDSKRMEAMIIRNPLTFAMSIQMVMARVIPAMLLL